MRILALGDIYGAPGVDEVAARVPHLRRELALDLVIANAENMAGGRGMTVRMLKQLRDAGVDVATSGNHTWDQRDMLEYLDRPEAEWVLRPLNLPPGAPGRGFWLREGVLVTNLMGRLMMRPIDCPFQSIDRLLDGPAREARVTIVDMHAEATSEKQAIGWFLDGRVSAVFGTHTHVATADARILPRGTAYISDIGMCGPRDSVIGMDPSEAIRGFLTGVPAKKPKDVADGPCELNGVLLDIDEGTGRARSIERFCR